MVISKENALKLAIITIISILSFFIPLPVSESAMIVFSILVFAALLWATGAIPLFLTSIIITILLVLFNVFTFKEAVSKFADPIFSRVNLNLADIAGLSIWIFCFVFLQACFIPLLNWISRNMEKNADSLAIEFSKKKSAFVSMMEKLSEQNLVERKPAAWVKIFFFDHPPIDERIALAEK